MTDHPQLHHVLARPALMSQLNPPPFSLRPRRPGILKRARSEIAALPTGRRLVISSESAMPVEKSVESLPALPDSSYILPVKATGKDAPDAEVTDSEFDGDGDLIKIPALFLLPAIKRSRRAH